MIDPAASSKTMHTRLAATLSTFPCTLTGSWREEWNRPTWGGTARCDVPFVLLLLGALDGRSHWAKSLPSDPANEIPVQFDPLPNREALFQLFLWAGNGAWLSQFITEFPASRRGEVPGQLHFETGALVRFLSPSAPRSPALSLLALAKQDVVVRRNHVWGLKPHLVNDVAPVWRSILARGRSGTIPLDLTA